MTEESKKHDPARRLNAPKALGLALGRLTRPVLKKRGAALADILSRWGDIAGPLLAQETQPERLIYAAGAGHGATLEIAVSPAFALEFQHLSPLIIEKVNGYFGYQAVAGLRLKQRPIQRPSESPPEPRPATRPLTAEEQARLAELLRGVEDRSLRQALESLGRSLLGAKR
ncbi:MAG TPA: DciA family protein [Ferrovibrio sp.]|jgi:hypothetical protein|uniref:DUF721 domain-containing protein n=1 Tax=Ferrovibrio sp. TaxID=1917215 RepID=UPI002B4AC59A|nr:DciA family protein [Ferrovibrio sp.]HLT77023.1 DciA family protein [Ferrovibrio sp.]